MRDSETTAASNLTGNRLVEALPLGDKTLLYSRCAMLTLEPGRIIAEPNQPIRYVYFPCTASISASATDSSSHRIDALLVGNEGMFGLPLVFGTDAWLLRGSVQCSGSSLRMPADDFKNAYASSSSLRRLLMRYSLTTLSQMVMSIVCAAFHSIECRLVCWMLMTQDRTRSHTFRITHELLSEALGVRRAGISVAAGSLQKRALIRYRHGHVTILDRTGLEALACDCYEAANAIYRAQMPVLCQRGPAEHPSLK